MILAHRCPDLMELDCQLPLSTKATYKSRVTTNTWFIFILFWCCESDTNASHMRKSRKCSSAGLVFPTCNVCRGHEFVILNLMHEPFEQQCLISHKNDTVQEFNTSGQEGSLSQIRTSLACHCRAAVTRAGFAPLFKAK